MTYISNDIYVPQDDTDNGNDNNGKNKDVY